MAPTPGNVNRWIVLTITMVGTFMAILDNASVNVALPTIMTAFGANVDQIKWITTGAMLTAAVTMPTTGWLGRRVGFGPLYVGALATFIGGSAFTASAWNLESLILGRVIQSVGAGIIQPTSMAILTRNFPISERGKAIGIWGVGIMLGPATGSLAGGFLTDTFSWRAVFLVNVPVGLLLILLAAVFLPVDRDSRVSGFDWAGFLALSVFLIVFLLTIDNGADEGWTSRIILLGLLVSAVSLAVFIVVELDAPEPMMPFRLFRSRNFVLSLWMGAMRALALFGPVFLVPIFLQRIQGRDPLQTGLLTIPSALSMSAMMPVAGTLTDRYGGRWPTFAGFLFSAYAMYLLYSVDPLFSAGAMIYAQVWRGIGVAFINAPVTTIGLNAVRRDDVGYASWMINLAQRYGGAFAVAVLSLLLHRWSSVQLDLVGTAALLQQDAPLELVHQAQAWGLNRAEAVSAVGSVLRTHVTHAADTMAYQNLFMVCALFSLAGIIPTLMVRPRPRGSEG